MEYDVYWSLYNLRGQSLRMGMDVPKVVSLKNAFEEAAREPARLFELRNGVSGIAGHYQFPYGMSAAEFEETYFWKHDARPSILNETDSPENGVKSLKGEIDEFLSRGSLSFITMMSQLWGELVQLNPILKEVKIDKTSPHQVYHALLGVTSGFNTDDINHYLRLKFSDNILPGMVARNNPVIKSIEERTHERMLWIPAQETLEKIERQISAPGWKKPTA